MTSDDDFADEEDFTDALLGRQPQQNLGLQVTNILITEHCYSGTTTEASTDKEGATAQADADIDLYSGVGGSAGLSGVAERASTVLALTSACLACKLQVICCLLTGCRPTSCSVSCIARAILLAPSTKIKARDMLAIAIAKRLQLALLLVKEVAATVCSLCLRTVYTQLLAASND